ncbi:CPBP family glutamic-type intramembrane protease [Acidovorax sp.]|uniref:CPBP family glutamic-type intramembrane protease n=1 Tax=Acidovorax sp. TaxID=1872122 RepID=UPI003CFC38CD
MTLAQTPAATPGGADFPFYNGRPLALGAGRWCVLLLGAALGFAALYLPMPAAWGAWGAVVPAILFPLVPLLALRAVAGPHWQVLFRRVGWRDVGLALGVALLNIAVTVLVALLVNRLFGEGTSNPAFGALGRMDTGERMAFFARTIPQLIGEEIITVLPFLAVLAWLSGPLGLGRGQAIVGAWLVSALIFGALHLPTYGWNVAQCLLVIGSARLVLLLAYLRTKSLAVSAMAHIANDWLLFAGGLVLGTAVGA